MIRNLAIVGALVAIGFGGFSLFGPSTSDVPAGVALVSPANAQDAADVDTSTIREMTLGNEDAEVTLIEYASYTCPHCARFHHGPFKQLMSDYIDTGKIKFVYREVYFDRYGLWASMIARCEPSKFFGINDLIYNTQPEWTRAGDQSAVVNELRKIGLLAGLDQDTMEACLQDGDKARTLVAWYQENQAADDVTGTPSFVLNGRKISNMPYAELSSLIEAELGS